MSVGRRTALLTTCIAGTVAASMIIADFAFAEVQDRRPSVLDQIKQRANDEAKKALDGALQGADKDSDDKPAPRDTAPAVTPTKVPVSSPTRTPPPVPTPTPTPTPTSTPKPVPTAPPRIILQQPVDPVVRPPVEPTVEEVPDPEKDSRPIVMRDADLPLFVDDEVLLFLKDKDAGSAEITASNGLTVVRSLTLDVLNVKMVTAKIASGDDVEGVVSRLQEQEAIAWAQPNYIYQLLGNSRDNGLQMHGLTADSTMLPQGLPPLSSSASIVMIDSPIDLSHESLSGANIVEYNFLEKSDPSPHGTAIAELLVGSGNFTGVARGARLISIPAFEPVTVDDWHAPSTSTTDYLVASLKRAQALAPDVMNLSFGSTAQRDDGVGKMLERMFADGVCIAAAAGNGGTDSPVRFPAKMDITIAVAAVNAGQSYYPFGSRGPEVDIAAWGVDINAAVPGGRRPVSGTSFAAPLVAGAMLRMPACLDANRPQAVRAALAQDAKDLGDAGRDNIFGAGLLRFGEGALASATITQDAIEAADVATDRSSHKTAAILAGGGGVAAAGLLFFAWRRRKKHVAK